MLRPPPTSTLFPYTTLFRSLRRALVRRLGPLIGDELAELGLLLVAHGLLEGDRRLRRALDRVDLIGLDARDVGDLRSEEHTSELQSHVNLVCRLLLEKKKKK